MPAAAAMEELEDEAAPVSRRRHSTCLGRALRRFTRLLAGRLTKPSRPPKPSTAPPPPLMEDLEEEILLRFPPHEPALLVRAALVCKRWRRLVSGPRFRRRYHELHRTPPMLGLFCTILDEDNWSCTCFLPAAPSAAFSAPDAGLRYCSVLDARHGRVLLHYRATSRDALMVWDPITDEAIELPDLDLGRYPYGWTAVVLCAATSTCNHLDCHHGPFLVVFAGSSDSGKVFICTYSSDAGIWSDPITTELPPLDYVDMMPKLLPSVLAGKALYFVFPFRKTLLKYDLESHELSVIGVPHTIYFWRHFLLDGGLALATVQESKLCIWRKDGPGVDAGWTQDSVIEPEKLLPDDALNTLFHVVGFADGIDVIFLSARWMLFTIDLKTYEVKKVCGKKIYSVIPYMSFCTPALGAVYTEEGSGVCASGA